MHVDPMYPHFYNQPLAGGNDLHIQTARFNVILYGDNGIKLSGEGGHVFSGKGQVWDSLTRRPGSAF